MPLPPEQLQARIGYTFRNLKLLYIALTHPSCQILHRETNRRLEFLGDRVISVLIAEELFTRYPIFSEGVLTNIHARLLSNASLAVRANTLGVGDYLTINSKDPAVRTLDSSLADAFEALVGAIKLDGGWEPASSFVLREFAADLVVAANPEMIFNPKGELQEYLQMFSKPASTYSLLSRTGPDNNPIFVCAALCGNIELGRGSGRTKREAESNAAKVALLKLRSASSPNI